MSNKNGIVSASAMGAEYHLLSWWALTIHPSSAALTVSRAGVPVLPARDGTDGVLRDTQSVVRDHSSDDGLLDVHDLVPFCRFVKVLVEFCQKRRVDSSYASSRSSLMARLLWLPSSDGTYTWPSARLNVVQSGSQRSWKLSLPSAD